MMRLIDRAAVREHFAGRRVALVGSGPGVLDNKPGHIDGFDVVVRVNNYKLSAAAGRRTDVHYSFFGSSIRKDAAELRADGVRLVLCKCPDAKFIESEWHRKHAKEHGVDFRYIYRQRAGWWWCDTYVPTLDEFVASFEMLQRHIPSTGFSALLLIASMQPAELYLTGFDFFASRTHNVDEPWRPGNPDDPIGHAPHLERAWLRDHAEGITFDPQLTAIMEGERAILDR